MNEQEEEIVVKEARELENAEEILEIPISYEERGKEIGRVEEKKELALRMLEKGMDIELIQEITAFTLDEIESLRKLL